MHILQRALLSLSVFTAVSSAYGERIIDTNFGENSIPIEGSENASGELPAGVIEDSAWADLKIHYSNDLDRLGSLTTWTRADLKELKNGRAQLKWPIPSPDKPSYYRLTTNIASPTRSLMRATVMQSTAPYTKHWEQSFIPDPNRKVFNFDFELPALKEDLVFILGMEQVGQYDIVSLQLQKRSAEEVEAAKAAAIAAAPDNLAPNVGFALGLPSAWGTGRNYSIVDRVQFRPAAKAGPHGTVPLQIDVIDSAASYKLYSAPFEVPDPKSIYIVSFIATGEGQGRVTLFSDGEETGSGSYQATPDGRVVKVPFRVKELAKWNVIQWSGSDDMQIDALNISMGRRPKPFSWPNEVEVALSANFGQANVFVEDVEEPSIRYAVSGELADGATLQTKTYNLYGQSSETKSITLSGENTKGRFQPPSPDGSRPYGSFRIEAWVERGGERISSVTEQVYHVVPKPVYWGTIAPESRFGQHISIYEPHLYGMKAIGVNWQRFHGPTGNFTTYWSAVEPQPGQWTWNDDNINRYREAGFATMGVLLHCPPWARADRAEARYNGWLDNWWQPRDYSEFANYVEQTTAHHKDNIDAWMVWNEPWGEFWFKQWRPDLNGEQRWYHGETPLEDFKELSRVAWEAYQKTGQNKPFLSVNGTLGAKGKKWMRDSIAIGTHQYGDGLSYHAYFGGNLRNVINRNSALVTNLERRVFDPIESNELAAEQPIWMTEGGWLLPDWGTGLHNHSVPGPEDLLQNVREISVRMPLYHIAQFENGVDKVFTYAVNAGPAFYKPTGSGAQNWGSMVTQTGELHPSATAYAAMAQRLEAPVFNRRIQIDSSTAAFIFEAEADALMVLASTESLNPYLDTFEKNELEVDDFLGNPATEGIEHQLLYVSLEDGDRAEALLGLSDEAIPTVAQP
jgi:hypothetical protein